MKPIHDRTLTILNQHPITTIADLLMSEVFVQRQHHLLEDAGASIASIPNWCDSLRTALSLFGLKDVDDETSNRFGQICAETAYIRDEEYTRAQLVEFIAETLDRRFDQDLLNDHLDFTNGNLFLEATHPVVPIMAQELIGLLAKVGAKNFLELRFRHPNRDEYAMLIQRVEGKTPSDRFMEVEAAVKEMISSIESIGLDHIRDDLDWPDMVLFYRGFCKLLDREPIQFASEKEE